MIGYKELKACKLETNLESSQIKKPCCEKLLDSERSAHDRSLSGTIVSVRVITDEVSRFYQEHERTFNLFKSVNPPVISVHSRITLIKNNQKRGRFPNTYRYLLL